MPIATGLAIGLGAAAAAGSVGSAAIGAHAAGKAASSQVNAANHAADLTYQSGQNALGFQEGVYNNTMNLERPYYNAGLSGLTNLENLMGILPSSAATTRIPQAASLNIGGPPGTPSTFAPNTSVLPNTSQLMNGGQAPRGNGPAMAPANTRTALGTPVSGGQVNPAGSQGGGPMTPSSGVRTAYGAPISVLGNNGQPLSFNPTAGATPGGVPSGASPSAPIPNSLSSLINPQLGASGSLMTPFLTPFNAPTSATEANDPGYQFRLNQGTQALDNSAAARGDLLSGNTLQGVTQFGQDYASNEYGNVYNRALQQYQLAQNNSTDIFNQLASVSGLGQTALQQIANTGTSAGSQVGNTLTNTASLMGQDIQNAGNATASGYANAGNAYGGALNNISQMAMLPYLAQLMHPNNG